MITISELHIYPIKSCRGIRLPRSTVEPHGLALDRRWMLIDESATFLSQRRLPQMARIEVRLNHDDALNADTLVVSWQHDGGTKETIDIPVAPPDGPCLHAKVWNDWVEARVSADPINSTLSRWLGVPCRLVHLAGPEARLRHLKIPGRSHPVSFADGAPVLLTNEATLGALSLQHGKELSMPRFRPNIVVSGAQAFAEESWQGIRAPRITFDGVYPCQRCIMIEVDQDAGVRNEPVLGSLQRARPPDVARGVYFGVNLVPDGFGTLSEGDTVEVY